MPVKLTGLQNVRKALAAAREIAGGKKLLQKLRGEADMMVANLQRRAQELTPVDEGTLRGEARSKVHFRQTALYAEVSFGGLATAYAEVQHEREDFEHPKGGTHHFLYGTPHSAWDSSAREVLRVFDLAAVRIAEQHISSATGGRP